MSTDRLIDKESAAQLNPANQGPAMLAGIDQSAPGSSDVSVASIVEKASNGAALRRSFSIMGLITSSASDSAQHFRLGPGSQDLGEVEPGLEAPPVAAAGALGGGVVAPASEGGTPANRPRAFQRGGAVAQNPTSAPEKNSGSSPRQRLARILAEAINRGRRVGGRQGDRSL